MEIIEKVKEIEKEPVKEYVSKGADSTHKNKVMSYFMEY